MLKMKTKQNIIEQYFQQNDMSDVQTESHDMSDIVTNVQTESHDMSDIVTNVQTESHDISDIVTNVQTESHDMSERCVQCGKGFTKNGYITKHTMIHIGGICVVSGSVNKIV